MFQVRALKSGRLQNNGCCQAVDASYVFQTNINEVEHKIYRVAPLIADATPPTDKIHPLSTIAITFEPIIKFGGPLKKKRLNINYQENMPLCV